MTSSTSPLQRKLNVERTATEFQSALETEVAGFMRQERPLSTEEAQRLQVLQDAKVVFGIIKRILGQRQG